MPKSPLEVTVHREMVKFLVQKAIFCPRMDTVLDVRTCVVLVDRDGDPTAVLSQEGFAELEATNGLPYLEQEYGITVDRDTVKGA